MLLTYREELAIAAGFWNGEGCCFAKAGRKRNDGTFSFQPHCSIEQCDDEQLYFFATVTGIGKVDLNPRQRKPTHRPVHVWSVYGFEKGQALAAMLWFGLSTEKKDQFTRVLLECRKYKDMRAEANRERRTLQ